jgi:hypothetical protein
MAIRRLATSSAGRVVEAAGTDLSWRSMIPICHVRHLRGDPYIEGDKEPYFPVLSTQSGSELTQSRCCTEASSLKTTSSGPVKVLREFLRAIAKLEERDSFGRGFRARCRSNSAASGERMLTG